MGGVCKKVDPAVTGRGSAFVTRAIRALFRRRFVSFPRNIFAFVLVWARRSRCNCLINIFNIQGYNRKNHCERRIKYIIANCGKFRKGWKKERAKNEEAKHTKCDPGIGDAVDERAVRLDVSDGGAVGARGNDHGAGDAGADRSTDSRADGSTDARADGSADRGPDGSADGSADGGPDRGPDRSADRGPDRSADRGPDGSADRGPDRGPNGSPDRSADGSADRGTHGRAYG